VIDLNVFSSVEDPIKPRMRGWIHLISAVLAIPAVWMMVSAANPGHQRAGALTYGISLIFLLSTSGSYHTPTWPPRTRAILRLIDHSMIFVFIGGSYTPFLLASTGDIFDWFLPLVWVMALLGILRTLFLPNVSRWLKSGIYMIMGWVAVPLVGMWIIELGPTTVGLLLGGGLIYTFGGGIYAKQRPNPWPATFGYHELFHVTVVLGSVCHYWAVWRVVT